MKLSVVIPTYNRLSLIGPAIDSALAQDVADLEVMVVDDGSTDATLQWLAAHYAGRPVRGLRNTRSKGPAGGRNTGILAAQGEFIALLDSDDAFLPGHLSQALAAFETHPELGVVFGRARYERNGQAEGYMGPLFDRKLGLAPQQHANEDITLFTPGFFAHLLQYGCWFNLSTVVLRTAAARELMNETLRISEDYEFWVRLSRQHRFACLHRPQIRYALHDDNISFEAAGSAADHAPRLLQALGVMRGYSGLSAAHTALIDQQQANILFDWAYRCRLRRDWRQAALLHTRSLRLGRRADNLLALAKLPLLALRPQA
jgi:glycosyltransferase involved in cell wall biosynthesis